MNNNLRINIFVKILKLLKLSTYAITKILKLFLLLI